MEFPYLKYEAMEQIAAQLLWDYEQKFGKIAGYEFPLEEFVELHLGLDVYPETQHSDDMDVLGSLNIETKTITINENLYPEDAKAKAGRYRFTLGHEAAHWILHAPLVLEKMSMPSLFDNDESRENIIMCRTSSKRDMIEGQADYLSGAILMPVYKLRDAWQYQIGDRPLLLKDVAGSVSLNFSPDIEERAGCWVKNQGLCDAFNVSPKAMVIRLKQIGLLTEESKNLAFCY